MLEEFLQIFWIIAKFYDKVQDAFQDSVFKVSPVMGIIIFVIPTLIGVIKFAKKIR